MQKEFALAMIRTWVSAISVTEQSKTTMLRAYHCTTRAEKFLFHIVYKALHSCSCAKGLDLLQSVYGWLAVNNTCTLHPP